MGSRRLPFLHSVGNTLQTVLKPHGRTRRGLSMGWKRQTNNQGASNTMWWVEGLSKASLERRREYRLPRWSSAEESTCQHRAHGFDPWSGKIACASGQLSLCATNTEPTHPRAHAPRKERPLQKSVGKDLKLELPRGYKQKCATGWGWGQGRIKN